MSHVNDFIPSAAEAITQSSDSYVITQEVFIILLNIQNAIAFNMRSCTVSAATVTTVVGTDITGSIMTNSDTSTETYYDVWQGTITDTVKAGQMEKVINYFTKLGYSISRKSADSQTMYWSITW